MEAARRTRDEDRQLVAAVLANQPRAFEQLVAAHQTLVWHVVHRMVGDAEDTRELSQEVFLRVFRRLAQFRFDAALATWIGHVAFSVAARHLRRRRLPMLDPHAAPIAADGPCLLDALPDALDLEREVADAELQAHLAAAIDALPPLLRTIITLFHLDELGIPEIAAITDLPAGTIKSHLFRTRRHLRQRLLYLTGDLP